MYFNKFDLKEKIIKYKGCKFYLIIKKNNSININKKKKKV